MAVEVVEAPALWVVQDVMRAEVPLADGKGPVSGVPEVLREQFLAQRQTRAEPRLERDEHAGPERRPARHECTACRRTHRMRVEAIEDHAFRGEPVDRRGPDLAAVIADIVPAEVVGDEEDDVGHCVGRRAGKRQDADHCGELACETAGASVPALNPCHAACPLSAMLSSGDAPIVPTPPRSAICTRLRSCVIGASLCPARRMAGATRRPRA